MPLEYATTGPHIHSRDSVSQIMWTIVLSLAPVTAAAVWLFGPYALYTVLSCAVASVIFEIPFAPHSVSRTRPLGDGSAFVGGTILGLTLSPGSPWWIPIVGAALLVVIGKQVFGGLGNNIFNPALVARAILLLSWPLHLTTWVSPFDAVTTATPLAGLDVEYISLFLGTIPGSLGETSVVALLIGAAFLVAKGLISWRVPTAVLIGAVFGALLFGADPLFTVLSGSLMFGAVFMATDMVTSPTGKTASVVYGLGCGFLTVVIREFTAYPEGITFAFLVMNGVAYLIDRIGADPFFGQVEKRKKRTIHAGAVALAIALAAGVVGAAEAWRGTIATGFVTASTSRAIRSVFPDVDRVVDATSYDPAVRYYRVYRSRELLGFFSETDANGYGGPMKVYLRTDAAGIVTAVRIGENNESPTVGTRVASVEFLRGFAGFSNETRDDIIHSVDTIAGATISTRTVIRAIERILGARDESTRRAPTGAPLPVVADGTYTGSGRGYQGPITVNAVVEGGRVVAIEIESHSETAGVGGRALETLTGRVINSQTLGVEAVSGATGTTEGFLAAVRDALED